MSNMFHFNGDIDVDRLAKYIRIDLERADEHGDIVIPCAACGIGQCEGGTINMTECRKQEEPNCRKMGGEKGSYDAAWWFLHLAEMSSKPVNEVASIKCERYEDYEDEEEPQEVEPSEQMRDLRQGHGRGERRPHRVVAR